MIPHSHLEANIAASYTPSLIREVCRSLRELLHQRCPSAQLIWYDAVTMDGELKWQNTLNAHNRLFFEACDAIFVNYTWKVRTLLRG